MLSDVIVEDCRFVHMYMYIQKGKGVFAIVLCCGGMYEEYCKL